MRRTRRGLGATAAQHTKAYRLRSTASRAASKLAIKNAKSGNCAEALHWLRRAAENDGAASAHYDEMVPAASVSQKDVELRGLTKADLNKAERVVRSCKL